jgi:hypothetical protein
MDWLDVVVKVATPVFAAGGLVGSGLTIWWNWGVEKRRLCLQRRQELIDTWRRELIPKMEGPVELRRGTKKYPFMRTPEYASLRPHLSPEFVQRLEGQALPINVRMNAKGEIGEVIGNFPHKEIIEEIARIERKWGLI